MPEDNTTPARPSATMDPTTWGEYFRARRLATLEIGSAHAAFKEAGRRLDAATEHKDGLEVWAREAAKVAPYTGESMRDDVVTIPHAPMARRGQPGYALTAAQAQRIWDDQHASTVSAPKYAARVLPTWVGWWWVRSGGEHVIDGWTPVWVYYVEPDALGFDCEARGLGVPVGSYSWLGPLALPDGESRDCGAAVSAAY